MKRYFPSTLLLCLLLAPPAVAQQAKGDVELQLAGSLASTLGDDNVSATAGHFQAKFGYFLTDRIEVGGFPGLIVTSITFVDPFGGRYSETEAQFGLGLFAVYSFLAADAASVPYVGAQWYQPDVSESSAGWAGVNGGIKFFFNRRTAFDVGGNYLFPLEGARGSGMILLQIGLSFLM